MLTYAEDVCCRMLTYADVCTVRDKANAEYAARMSSVDLLAQTRVKVFYVSVC
jgi:hypothetical protein